MDKHQPVKFHTEGDRIDHALSLHPPVSEAIGARMDEVRVAAKSFAHTVDALSPNGRYKSLALTAIEEACMRAIGAIALDQAACVESDAVQ